MNKFRDWFYLNIKGWANPPCECHPFRTRLSICSNVALKANYELIKNMQRPATMPHKKDPK